MSRRPPAPNAAGCGADETASSCDAQDCLTLMTARDVYAWATIGGFEVRVCSEACLLALSAHEAARVACSLCTHATTDDDRLPWNIGGRPGVAHRDCVAKLSNALGFERAAKFRKNHMGVVRGGRS